MTDSPDPTDPDPVAPLAPLATAARRWRRPDTFLVAVLVGAFVLRLAWSVYAARPPTSFGDPFSYLTHADELASGKGYVTFFYGRPTAYYPVGYPAVLGGFLWLARLVAPGTSALQVAIGLNLVCGTATVAVVFALARQLAGTTVARVAALLVALFPSLILYTATAYLETVFCFLVAVIAWLLVRTPGRDHPTDRTDRSDRSDRTADRPTAAIGTGRPRTGLAVPPWPALLALGGVFALATMIRPITLAFLPVLLLAWGFGRPGWARSLGAVAVVAGIVALAVVPWSIRSTRALGATVIISTNTGDNLCIGHSPESRGEYIDLNALCGGGYDDVPEDLREAERNRQGTARALTYAREHPAREVTLLARKAFHLVAHDHEGVDAVESYGADPFLDDTARSILRFVADAFYYLVGALAVGGAAWVAWRGDSRSRLVLAWATTLLAVPLIFFGGSRFHLPALPFAAMFAAITVEAVRRRIRPAATAAPDEGHNVDIDRTVPR